MDPTELVVSAIVAGAAAGLKDQAAQVVKDAYGALKRLLTEHNVPLDVIDAVERKPGSVPKQNSLREDLADTRAAEDREVFEAAKELTDLVRQHQADVAAARGAGIDIDRLHTSFLKLKNITLSGPGAVIDFDDVIAPGGIEIEGVDVDARGDPTHP